MLVFSGRAKVRIHQQRLVFPVEFREQYLEEGENYLLVTIRPDFRAILIYPYSSWESFQEAMNSGTEDQQDIISTMEFYAQPKQGFEKLGRIRIEPDLLEKAGIKDGEGWMLGEGRVVSLWSPGAFTEEERERNSKTSGVKYRSSVFKTWNSTTTR